MATNLNSPILKNKSNNHTTDTTTTRSKDSRNYLLKGGSRAIDAKINRDWYEYREETINVNSNFNN